MQRCKGQIMVTGKRRSEIVFGEQCEHCLLKSLELFKFDNRRAMGLGNDDDDAQGGLKPEPLKERKSQFGE